MVLIDTNILIYAWDSSDKEKQSKAIMTLQENRHKAYLSIQNLSEFASFMVRNKCNSDWLQDTLATYQEVFTILPLQPNNIADALRAVQEHQLSYWDAQIWAVAKANRIPTIFSEDGPTGRSILSVTFINPLI